MNALFLLAGATVGYRCSVTALVFALPASIAAAVLLWMIGETTPGVWHAVVRCILFQFGFFGGCVIHSWQADRQEERHRFAGKNPGRSR